MRNLVAFYSSKDQAKKAKDDLTSAGFDHNDVKIFEPRKDEGGFWESIKESFGFADEHDRQLYAEASRRGATAVGVSFDHDEGEPTYQQAVQILQKYSPMDLDQHATQWRQQGWTGQQAATTATAATQRRQTKTATTTGTPSDVIPVVQEELQVGKRAVAEGGVRVHTRVTEKPVEEQVTLRQERVTVERRPADRPVTAADQPFQERVIEAASTSEQAVVNKQARVVEEVAINKDVHQQTKNIKDTVRRTDVEVEKLQPGQVTATSDTTWTNDFANELCTDQRFRGRDWATIEPDARTSFERRYPERKWDQFKDSIHNAYVRARSKV
jgi:uncharacterized protein (TIGR02271 family)